jgi:hypothetical protein
MLLEGQSNRPFEKLILKKNQYASNENHITNDVIGCEFKKSFKSFKSLEIIHSIEKNLQR